MANLVTMTLLVAGLPLVLVTSAAAVVALVSVASDLPERRKHSLLLPGRLAEMRAGPSRPLRTTARPLILPACENEAIGFHQAVDQSRGGW